MNLLCLFLFASLPGFFFCFSHLCPLLSLAPPFLLLEHDTESPSSKKKTKQKTAQNQVFQLIVHVLRLFRYKTVALGTEEKPIQILVSKTEHILGCSDRCMYYYLTTGHIFCNDSTFLKTDKL